MSAQFPQNALATAHDFPSVIELYKKIFIHKSLVLQELEQPQARLWCSKTEDQLAAFLWAWQVAGELQILDIGVDEKQRRRGVGSALLRHALEACFAAGIVRAILDVHEKNPAALALYQGAGFIPIGRRKNYYPDGGDAIVMERRLPIPADRDQ